MMITFTPMTTTGGNNGNYYYGASSRRDWVQASRRRRGAIARPSPAFWRGDYDLKLSVDPWTTKYPYVTPYNFVENNPIMLVDPDGNGPWQPDGSGGWVAEKGDGAETLAQDAGISREEAYKKMEEQGHGTYTDKDGVTKSAVDPGDVVQVENRNSSSTSSSSCTQSCTPTTSTKPQSVSETVSQSSGGQLNLVGLYGEGSWYLSGVAGQDYGMMYSENVGFMTYRTDQFGFRSEAASFGAGGGLIYFTNSSSMLNKGSFNGELWDIQLNYSVGVGDAGGSISIAPVETRGFRDFLIFIGGQGSVGASTPVASGGVTRGNTTVH